MPYADFSYAVLRRADLKDVDLRQGVLHRTDDEGANWSGARRENVRTTDQDLAEAEDWAPPSLVARK
jgi:uncharacterized protein YjbI with pentapeptide repeats